MKRNIIFILSGLGVVAGLVGAYFFGLQRKAQPPVFAPAASPYAWAIYANGIVESDQTSGSNINIYPEVAGPVTRVRVHEGHQVSAATPLLEIDESVQRATAESLRLQADAALSLWNELKAQPRKETLDIAKAQVDLAESNLKVDRDQFDKRSAAYTLDPKSVSKDVVDTAKDTLRQAVSALDVAHRQYDLTKAGAWSYDILNQERLYESLTQSYRAAELLRQKYSLKAPVAGIVLAINATTGGYVSNLGVYDTYTSAMDPLIVMGASQQYMVVRCYVDEILVSRLPAPDQIFGQLSIRGTDVKVPLSFVRVQPYVSPKIELSNERQERVDLRVLPVLFRFEKKNAPVYPGQLVDVYIGKK